MLRGDRAEGAGDLRVLLRALDLKKSALTLLECIGRHAHLMHHDAVALALAGGHPFLLLREQGVGARDFLVGQHLTQRDRT